MGTIIYAKNIHNITFIVKINVEIIKKSGVIMAKFFYVIFDLSVYSIKFNKFYGKILH